jgi:hypothetical protein
MAHRASLLLGRTPELGLRALLRNLRLLRGLRAADALDVVVAGAGAPAVAAQLGALEPALRLSTVGDGALGALGARALAGRALASVIVCQPFHVMRARDELADLRAALDPEEGTLGFIWTRALARGWGEAFSRAAGAAGAGAGAAGARAAGALPGLAPGETPMAWFDALAVGDFGFHALKHRKFVERVGAPTPEVLDALPLVHDARFALGGAEPAFAAGAAAAAAAWAAGAAARKDEDALALDLHFFSTRVVRFAAARWAHGRAAGAQSLLTRAPRYPPPPPSLPPDCTRQKGNGRAEAAIEVLEARGRYISQAAAARAAPPRAQTSAQCRQCPRN